jgi:hypothetical protein
LQAASIHFALSLQDLDLPMTICSAKILSPSTLCSSPDQLSPFAWT